ncbi:metalloregulator ArsR/SmtB family transcription factor [bacterium]|nr:metalloregulator ArsR/SmtB family transcription factor [bacterium]
MDIALLLKALADDSRLRLVHLLSHGSFNVQELTRVLSLSQSTVSHHLKILVQAGLVSHRKEGAWSFYAVNEQLTLDKGCIASAEGSIPSAEGSIPSAESSFEVQLLSLITGAVTQAGKLSEVLEADRRSMKEIFSERRDRARRYFEEVAPQWGAIRDQAQGTADYLPLLQNRIPKEGSLLEVGCGSGMLLKQLLPRSGDTIGVDYSEAMIQEARENLCSSPSSAVDLRLGYLEHLPIGDETINCALACMVFHHIAEPREALKDIARVLRPCGELYIIDLVEHEQEVMRERYADLWLGFQTETFKGWVAQSGFHEVNVEVLGKNHDVFLLYATKNKG